MRGCDEQHDMMETIRVTFYSDVSKNKSVILKVLIYLWIIPGSCLCCNMKIKHTTVFHSQIPGLSVCHDRESLVFKGNECDWSWSSQPLTYPPIMYSFWSHPVPKCAADVSGAAGHENTKVHLAPPKHTGQCALDCTLYHSAPSGSRK